MAVFVREREASTSRRVGAVDRHKWCDVAGRDGETRNVIGKLHERRPHAPRVELACEVGDGRAAESEAPPLRFRHVLALLHGIPARAGRVHVVGRTRTGITRDVKQLLKRLQLSGNRQAFPKLTRTRRPRRDIGGCAKERVNEVVLAELGSQEIRQLTAQVVRDSLQLNAGDRSIPSLDLGQRGARDADGVGKRLLTLPRVLAAPPNAPSELRLAGGFEWGHRKVSDQGNWTASGPLWQASVTKRTWQDMDEMLDIPEAARTVR